MKPNLSSQVFCFMDSGPCATVVLGFLGPNAVLNDRNVKRSRESASGLAQQAYDLIRERILRGQFPFGTTISRRELSQELGMSTLPVSEALQRLQNEALVVTVPRVGTM